MPWFTVIGYNGNTGENFAEHIRGKDAYAAVSNAIADQANGEGGESEIKPSFVLKGKCEIVLDEDGIE